MLRSTTRRLAISAYTLFMLEQKGNASLRGLPVTERGRTTAKLYYALSPTDRQALARRAAAHASLKRHVKVHRPRRPNTYNLFVQRAMQLPEVRRARQPEKLKIVARMWRAHKARGATARAEEPRRHGSAQRARHDDKRGVRTAAQHGASRRRRRLGRGRPKHTRSAHSKSTH